MPKVIQMPRRNQPEDQNGPVRHSMIPPDTFEESESLARIQRWLEMADSVLEDKKVSLNKRPA